MFVAIKKSTIILSAILLATAIACGAFYFGTDSLVEAGTENRLIPVYSVDTDKDIVALTFDAAWGADKTAKIVEILDDAEMKGTFFLVGFWIDEHEDMVRLIDEKGFLIGNHSAHHPHMSTLSEEKVKEELLSVNDKIESIIEKRPEFFRAPFGEYDNTVISAATSLGMQTVQWDVDTLDWKGLSGQDIARRVLDNVKRGSVILMHNNSDHVLDALPLIIEGLKEKGLTSVTLDRLVYKDNYIIKADGTQQSTK